MKVAKKKIMVVDDSRYIVKVARRILELENFEVVPAYNGEECLDKLKKGKPDLILLDSLMPMSGVNVLKRVLKSNPEAKVIMLTVMDQKQVIEECKQLGAVDYITKPFDNKDLIRRVKQIVGG